MSSELQETRFNSGDKGMLNDLNKRLKYPFKGKIKEIWQKNYALIQIALSDIEVGSKDGKFNTISAPETNWILQQSIRIIKSKNMRLLRNSYC
jgi:hypothetical protein